ncbi:MAG TPA: hypothetical protein VFE45_14005, partial [Coriobacteriia bacterium]|nr:hypothetical protein [Coriobacteriia bacterium]
MRERIHELLAQKGPLTGAEIGESLGGETFALWKTCMLSPRLATRTIGRRYVRLDRQVEGYARLSPSILREFLTYTVVGLADDPATIDLRARELQSHIERVSREKLELATRIVTDVAEPLTAVGKDETRFSIVVAGDIVYQMAHDVSRPERSTGGMVRGSDLDIVVIVADDAPEDLVTQLDESIYRKKYQYLKHPAFREEIDYVVKRFSKLAEQSEFDTFERMVACKIFDEAVLLNGSRELFNAGQALLRERGVIEQLREMEHSAIAAREEQERYLLATDEEVLRREDLFLFYT